MVTKAKEQSEAYKIAMQFKYMIAIDKSYYNNDKKYYSHFEGFNTMIEYENYIKLNKTAKRISYEVIKEICKAYFDFDKINITKNEFNEFLTLFIQYFNKFFKTSITINDLLIYYRKNINSPTLTSIHIIVLNMKFEKKQIQIAIEYFKLMINNEISKSLDLKIYSQKRQFNLPYNTKLKYYDNDFKNPLYFEDYTQEQKINSIPKNYLASYTETLPLVKIEKNNKLAFDIFKIFEKKDISKLKLAFNKMKNHNNNEAEIVVNETLNFYEPLECFEKIVSILPINFFFSNDWKTITHILKKLGLSSVNFDIWNKASILKTGKKWTEEQNMTWYKQLDINKCNSGLPMFKKILEQHIKNTTFEFYYNTELINWLNDLTKIDKEEIESSLLNQGERLEIGNYKYNTKTGFLYEKTNSVEEFKIINNYYTEVEIKKIHSNLQINNLIEVDTIQEVKPFIETFNTNQQKSVLAIKAKWGSGKTYFIIKYIIDYAFKNKQRVICITENNSLNKQLVKQFSQPDKGIVFISHINTSKDKMNGIENIENEEENPDNIVCSTESIQKITIRETDLLILDEAETLLNHFESETFNNQHLKKWDLFTQALMKVNKIAILDADLSGDRIELFKQITQVNFQTIYAKTNNFSDYNFNVYLDNQEMINDLHIDIKNNKKVLFASSSKNYLDFLFTDLALAYKDKTIIKLTGVGVEIFKNGNLDIKITKNQLLDNFEELLIFYETDIFLFSPTIKTGISINTEYFNKCYAYAYHKTICSREFIQMLFRARNLIDKTINININTPFKKTRPYVTQKEVKKYLLDPIFLLQTFKIFEEQIKEENEENENEEKLENHIIIDKNFLQLKTLNHYENYNSKTRFNQDFILRMVYNHNIKLNFIDYTFRQEEIKEPEKDIEVKEEKQTEIILSEFVKARLISHIEYNSKTNFNWIEKQKYKLFYEIYNFKGITDRIEYDTNIYNSLNNNIFYETYNDKETISQYKIIKHILNKTTEDLKENYTNFIEITKQNNNSINGVEKEINLKVMSNKLLTYLEMDLNHLPYKISNSQFETLVKNFNFTGFNKELQEFLNSYYQEHKFNCSFVNINYLQNIKKVIIKLLSEIGVSNKYVNKHTTEKNDKMIFYFKDFKTPKKMFYGRLTDKDLRLNQNEVKLVRQTKNSYKTIQKYKTENERIYNGNIRISIINEGLKAYQTNNPNYFITYEPVINKELNKLMNYIQNDSETIKTNMNKVFLELLKPKMSKPYIITDLKYKMKNDLVSEYLNNINEVISNKTFCLLQIIQHKKYIETNVFLKTFHNPQLYKKPTIEDKMFNILQTMKQKNNMEECIKKYKSYKEQVINKTEIFVEELKEQIKVNKAETKIKKVKPIIEPKITKVEPKICIKKQLFFNLDNVNLEEENEADY